MLNQILDVVTGPALPAVLVVLKATMVLLLAIGLTTLMQRASATSRHLVWVASLLALLVIPVLAAWSPVRFALLPASWVAEPASVVPTSPASASLGGALRTAEAPVDARSAAMTGEVSVPAASIVASDASRDGIRSFSPWQLILFAWIGVASALLLRLVHGMLSVRRIVRGATPIAEPEWQGTMVDIADRLEMNQLPALVRSGTVTMPFACGLRRPTIVLPHECEQWSSERRAAVLLHELAHIRRRDIVGHALGRVACALYWFHPMAWMAARRMRAESERACDDLALSCGTRASDYAEHLLDIVTSVRNHATPSMAMAMATRSEFEGRMLAILDPSLTRTSPTRMQASTLSGGVMMFAIVTGSVVPKTASVEPPQLPGSSGWSALAADTTRDAARRDTAPLARDVARNATRAADAADPDTIDPDVEDPDIVDPDGDEQPVDEGALTGRTGNRNANILATHADSSARAGVLARILRTDSAASLRRTAAWGLNDFTDNDTAREALLYAVRRDPSAEVREMAAWALSDAADDSRVSGVLAEVIAQDRDRSVRETAVWSLGDGANGRSAAAITALASALKDDDPQVRELAAWGIGNASPRRAPAELIAVLGDRNPRVRRTAAWALFQIEDAEATEAIDTALQKEMDADARFALVRALSSMGDRAVAPLQRVIESTNAPLRAVAIRALAGQGGDPWPQPRPRPRPYP